MKEGIIKGTFLERHRNHTHVESIRVYLSLLKMPGLGRSIADTEISDGGFYTRLECVYVKGAGRSPGIQFTSHRS